MTSKQTSDICHWSLSFSFKEKATVAEFVRLLMDQDIDFDFDVECRLLDVGQDYLVSVNDMSWASNLLTVAEILKGLDYDMDNIGSETNK